MGGRLGCRFQQCRFPRLTRALRKLAPQPPKAGQRGVNGSSGIVSLRVEHEISRIAPWSEGHDGLSKFPAYLTQVVEFDVVWKVSLMSIRTWDATDRNSRRRTQSSGKFRVRAKRSFGACLCQGSQRPGATFGLVVTARCADGSGPTCPGCWDCRDRVNEGCKR